MWRLLHQWLPTQDVLKRQKISLASKCMFCESEETTNHLFVQCNHATAIWTFFEHQICVFPSHRGSIYSKLKSWWEMRFSIADQEVLSLLASLITWEIWKSRNSCLHEGKKFPPSKICDRIVQSIRSISEAKPFSAISAPLKRILHLFDKHPKPRICLSVFWTPPTFNRVKLNVDGSSLGSSGASGGGGIIRNHLGTPLFGFSCFYGFSSSITAECKALRDGILMCLQHGFQCVDVEMDSLYLLQMILGNSKIAWHLDGDIRKIKNCTAGQNYSFTHIFREANAVADSLATAASSYHQSYIFDNSCIPQAVKGIIALDAIQFPYIRVK